jgi:immune inhibitor A
VGLLGLSLAATSSLALGGGSAFAALPSMAPAAAPAVAEPALGDHDLPNPLEAKRRELREQAVAGVLKGDIKTEVRNGSVVAKVGENAGANSSTRSRRGQQGKKDQYVELSNERTDKIFGILAEFGNERHPDFPDKDMDPSWPGPTKFDGPLHNEIPAPNRAVDNSTYWEPDFNAEHYRNLYFGTDKGDESLKQYYEVQSSGRYSVEGEISDWVKVRYNEARYGRSGDVPDDENGDDPNVCEDIVCENTWDLIADSANAWVAKRQAEGATDAEIAEEARSFDQYDRYDFDGDGIFNEADGYIDHFQIVHAGGDEADGDPIQGEDAIWSHRWYAFITDEGRTGPADNKLGGTQIGNTGIWIGDYTIQPENGGRSVFYHEYGHDLGLPDDYNILNGGDNNNEHWTLMAQSRLGAKGEPYIGNRGGDLGAWNKLQLGWLDYEIVAAGDRKTINLGPQEYNSNKAQAAVVVLPDREYTFDLGAPFAGEKQFFSGNADDLDNSMTRTLDLTDADTAALSLKGRYNIEAGYDYLYFEASTDGTTWTALDGTIDGKPLPRDASGKPALTGNGNLATWHSINLPLDAYAGQDVQFRFHYRTDGGVSRGGFFADEVTLAADGATVFVDGAETDGADWELDGFEAIEQTVTRLFDNFYIAGHRSYVSYDKYLKTGPYFFGYANTKPDYVDHYAYQEGLLISYWNTRWTDNDTFEHPGEGRNLYIDSRPAPMRNIEGAYWRARIQVYDAPFSLKKADSFTLHINSKASYIRGQAAQPLFDDTKKYWYEELPNHGVKLPAAGVKIRVLERDGTSMKIRIS